MEASSSKSNVVIFSEGGKLADKTDSTLKGANFQVVHIDADAHPWLLTETDPIQPSSYVFYIHDPYPLEFDINVENAIAILQGHQYWLQTLMNHRVTRAVFQSCMDAVYPMNILGAVTLLQERLTLNCGYTVLRLPRVRGFDVEFEWQTDYENHKHLRVIDGNVERYYAPLEKAVTWLMLASQVKGQLLIPRVMEHWRIRTLCKSMYNKYKQKKLPAPAHMKERDELWTLNEGRRVTTSEDFWIVNG